MQKFDASCGLTKKQIGIIKFNVKNGILRQLPILPEHVETKLFFEGRDAWIYSWRLLNKQKPVKSTDKISLDVVVKLKREFHDYHESTQHKFSCKVLLKKDIYRPKVSVTKNSA